jgi:DmsE family decaheme c-type cytochrome
MIKQSRAAMPYLFAALVIGSSAVGGQSAAQELDGRTVTTLCNGCHADKLQALAANPHSALDSQPWLDRAGVVAGCLACHGNVNEHIRSGGRIDGQFTFRTEPLQQQAEQCLGCHEADHPQFATSPHARSGLSCTSCHSQHSSAADNPVLLKIDAGLTQNVGVGSRSQSCVGCHGAILTQFSYNERHRLREGALECVSCHDPHEPQNRQLLGGFKEDQCTSCHADKGGPYVFEHDASRVEGCTACHSPHGSPNRHMLAHQRVAELCIACHVAVPQFHLGFSPVGPPRFNLDTQCTNCHSAIHGSNFSEVFLQ